MEYPMLFRSTKPEAYDPSVVSASVTAGNHRLNAIEAGEEKRSVAAIRFHPSFLYGDKIGMTNDVALIKLDKPVKFSETIRPVCLPKSGEPLPLGKMCVAAGWGRNDSRNF